MTDVDVAAAEKTKQIDGIAIDMALPTACSDDPISVFDYFAAFGYFDAMTEGAR